MCRGWSGHLGAPRHVWRWWCTSQVYESLVLLGHLSRKPSAPARPLYAGMIGPAPAQALFCLDTWLVQHRHLRRLGAQRCLEQSRLILVMLGHLSWTPSAPAHTLCVWGTWLVQHRHQWGLGVPRCLKQSRQMLVLPGALVSHTISISEALLRADAWTNIDSCLLLVGPPGWHNISTGGTLVLVLLGAPVWHTIGTSGPCCERMPRPALAHALCVWG